MGSARPPQGLCASCRHRKLVGNRRGSLFTLCLLSRTDKAFPRYPPLPVARCAGYEKGDEDPWQAFAEAEGDDE